MTTMTAAQVLKKTCAKCFSLASYSNEGTVLRIGKQRVEIVWVTITLIVWMVHGLFAEETYAIRLGRHQPHVGQEYQFRAELHQTNSTSFNSESRSQQTNTISFIELLARCKVLANDEDSERGELVIEHLIEHQDTNSNVLLAPGTVVIMKTVAGERFFTGAHVPLSLAVKKVFEQLLGSVSDETGCTQDQAFGTPEPKKIGDSWKANTDCLVKGLNNLNKYRGIVEPNQFEATMKFLGVEEAAGIKCLRLSLVFSVHTDKPPTARIAKDPRSQLFNAKWDTSFNYEAINLLPMDQDLPCLNMVEKGEAFSKVAYTSGKRFATMEFRSSEQKTVEIKLLK